MTANANSRRVWFASADDFASLRSITPSKSGRSASGKAMANLLQFAMMNHIKSLLGIPRVSLNQCRLV
jgi:hypothetical protein